MNPVYLFGGFDETDPFAAQEAHVAPMCADECEDARQLDIEGLGELDQKYDCEHDDIAIYRTVKSPSGMLETSYGQCGRCMVWVTSTLDSLRNTITNVPMSPAQVAWFRREEERDEQGEWLADHQGGLWS